MATERVMATQRAVELIEKMGQWEGVEVENNCVIVCADNPFLPEFNACLSVINQQYQEMHNV